MKTHFDTSLLAPPTQSSSETQMLRKKEALEKSCKDFEAIFIQSLFKAMRKTVPEGELFGTDSTTKTFLEMHDQEVATTISRTQSIGLAEQMYRQLEGNILPQK